MCAAYVDLKGLHADLLKSKQNANLATCEKVAIRACTHKTTSTMDFTSAAACSASRAGRVDWYRRLDAWKSSTLPLEQQSMIVPPGGQPNAPPLDPNFWRLRIQKLTPWRPQQEISSVVVRYCLHQRCLSTISAAAASRSSSVTIPSPI